MEITDSEDRGARISAAAEVFVYGYPLVYSLILRSPDRDPRRKDRAYAGIPHLRRSPRSRGTARLAAKDADL